MLHKYTVQKLVFLFIFSIGIFSGQAFAQGAKKPAPAGKPGKASTKGTVAADLDCMVTINGAAKPILVKAYTPSAVTLNVGDNAIQAITTDKKSTVHTTVNAKAGETAIVEISFFDDSKFLDYIKTGNVNMVEAALKKDPGLLNNENGTLTSSPLEMAIVNGQSDLTKYLIQKGASYSKPENIFPLHKSVMFMPSAKPAKDKPAPDREMVDFFLSKGAKITDKDDGGNTPLHCAVRMGKLDLIVYMVEQLHADVNAKNDFEDTPLVIAENKGMVTIITYLKSKGAVEK